MSDKVLDTHSLFIDTSAANKESLSKGDDFELHLNTQSIDADRGQFIRLTLNEFAMYKTFTNVNSNNSTFVTVSDSGTGKTSLTHQNYDTIHDIATEFANKVGTLVVADSTNPSVNGFVVSDLTPDATTGINGTTDNIISFTITTTATGVAAAHGLTSFLIQFFEEEGDTFALLGGNRIYGSTPSAENSLKTIILTNTLKFSCLYPAQRSTTSHIYLRTALTTGSSETASLSQETNIEGAPEMSYSSILGRIPVNSEFCIYEPSHDRCYFLDLHQKHLNNIRFFITDHKNRRIGRRPASSQKKTAAGNGNDQSTLGNLSFSCVLRVDVVQSYIPKELQFRTEEPIVNAKSSGVLLDIRHNPNFPQRR
jgi:hypothetical protein